MTAWFRRRVWHLVDILSSLELPPEKGCVWKLQTNHPNQSTATRTAVRLTVVSARHFRESFAFLRAALNTFSRYPKNLSIALYARCRLQLCILFARQSRRQTSRPLQDSRSCQPANSKKKGVSNAERVDCKSAVSEDSGIWQNHPKHSSPNRSQNTHGISHCSGGRKLP